MAPGLPPGHGPGPRPARADGPGRTGPAARARGSPWRGCGRRREDRALIISCEPHQPNNGGGADRFRWEEALEPLGPVMPLEHDRRCCDAEGWSARRADGADVRPLRRCAGAAGARGRGEEEGWGEVRSRSGRPARRRGCGRRGGRRRSRGCRPGERCGGGRSRKVFPARCAAGGGGAPSAVRRWLDVSRRYRHRRPRGGGRSRPRCG